MSRPDIDPLPGDFDEELRDIDPADVRSLRLRTTAAWSCSSRSRATMPQHFRRWRRLRERSPTRSLGFSSALLQIKLRSSQDGERAVGLLVGVGVEDTRHHFARSGDRGRKVPC